MSESTPTVRCARRVLLREMEALDQLYNQLGKDKSFEQAVGLVLECSGKVVLLGVGKSGLVARKIAATLASTGTPAFFVHPSEAGHGDCGMITSQDLCVLVTHSGETEEIVRILPSLRKLGVRKICITGGMDSTVAGAADLVLDTGVKREACSLGLVPTTSTTVSMVIGDILALCLMERRGFGQRDFAERHPAGSLGAVFANTVLDMPEFLDRFIYNFHL